MSDAGAGHPVGPADDGGDREKCVPVGDRALREQLVCVRADVANLLGRVANMEAVWEAGPGAAEQHALSSGYGLRLTALERWAEGMPREISEAKAALMRDAAFVSVSGRVDAITARMGRAEVAINEQKGAVSVTDGEGVRRSLKDEVFQLRHEVDSFIGYDRAAARAGRLAWWAVLAATGAVAFAALAMLKAFSALWGTP